MVFWLYYYNNVSKQKTLYNGIHLILFSNPKFLVDILIEYGMLYKPLNTFKLFDLVWIPDFTSIGNINDNIHLPNYVSLALYLL